MPAQKFATSSSVTWFLVPGTLFSHATSRACQLLKIASSCVRAIKFRNNSEQRYTSHGESDTVPANASEVNTHSSRPCENSGSSDRLQVLAMRSIAPILLTFLFSAAQAVNNGGYSPFHNPVLGLSNNGPLVKRQNNCQSGYNSCSSLGAGSACCPQNANCALDDAGNIACCPSGAECTGTIAGTATGSQTVTSSSSGFVLGGTTTSSTPITTSPGITSFTTGVAGGGSTVPNNFYPFIYIPTSYANADLCTSAYSMCQAQSTSCFASLAGANGVTVSGLGGGITQQGTTGTVLNSASTICSSLSAQGCYNLRETQCSIFGSGSAGTTATSSNGFVQVGNDGPRQTACPGMLYAAGAGAVFGAIGGLV